MPSSWEIYYVVFLSAVLALGIPLTLALLSRLVSPFRRAPVTSPLTASEPAERKENRSILGQRLNVRFFLGANASLILVTLALILIPCTVSLGSQPEAIRGFIAIVSVAAIAGLGLLYSARKGDLGWLRTFSDKLSSVAGDVPKDIPKNPQDGGKA